MFAASGWLAIVGSGLAAYFGSYMKQKGVNLATNEDLSMLVSQLKATTHATKQIESLYSGRLWEEQRQWELKRDSVLSALQALQLARSTLMEFAVACDQAAKVGPRVDNQLSQAEYADQIKWFNSMTKFDESLVPVRLICSRTSFSAFRDAGQQIRLGASGLMHGTVHNYDKMAFEINVAVWKSFDAARTELGIESDSQAATPSS